MRQYRNVRTRKLYEMKINPSIIMCKNVMFPLAIVARPKMLLVCRNSTDPDGNLPIPQFF